MLLIAFFVPGSMTFILMCIRRECKIFKMLLDIPSLNVELRHNLRFENIFPLELLMSLNDYVP